MQFDSSQKPQPEGPDAQLPRLPIAEDLSSARARALERLHALRVAQRAERAESRPLSRRDACAAAGAAVVAAAAWALLGRSVSSAQDRQRSQSLFQLEQAGCFAWETLLFQCGQVALGQLCGALRLPVGNASVSVHEVPKSSVVRTIEMFEKDPLLVAKLYGTAGFLAPAAEESFFRIIPGLLVRQQDGMQWGVGIPSSIAFAAIHNLIRRGECAERELNLGSGVRLSLDVVPLPQFLLGAYCWYVMRRYGDLAPVVAHAFNNQAAAFALVWGGKETFSDFQRLLGEELEAHKQDRRL